MSILNEIGNDITFKQAQSNFTKNISYIYYKKDLIGTMIELYPNLYDFKSSPDIYITKYVPIKKFTKHLLKDIQGIIKYEKIEYENIKNDCIEITIDANDINLGLQALMRLYSRINQSERSYSDDSTTA